MFDAPARPRRRRLTGFLVLTGVALGIAGTALAGPALAEGATPPPAPVFYEPTETYGTFADALNGTTQDLYMRTAEWSAGDTATGFVVRRDGGVPARDGGWTSSVIPGGAQPTDAPDGYLRLTHLTPSTTYTVHAKLVNAAGSSPETTFVFRTAGPAPAPAGTTATPVKGGVKLSWADPGDCIPYRGVEGEVPWCTATDTNGGSAITGWKVSRDGTDTGGNGAWSTVVGRTDAYGGYTRVFSKTLGYLRPGATYHVSVAAITKLGTGPARTLTVVVPAVPGAPAIRPAVAGGAGNPINATAVWAKPTNPGGTPTSYTVYAYRMSGSKVLETLTSRPVAATATSYTFPFAKTGTYTFRVKATGIAGTSGLSSASNAVAGR